jgi:hypothetical protein
VPGVSRVKLRPVTYRSWFVREGAFYGTRTKAVNSWEWVLADVSASARQMPHVHGGEEISPAAGKLRITSGSGQDPTNRLKKMRVPAE